MKHTHYFTHLSGNNWICSCGKEIKEQKPQRDFTTRYKKIAKSKAFKDAYLNRSTDIIVVD